MEGECDKDAGSYNAESRSWGLLNKDSGNLQKALRVDYKAYLELMDLKRKLEVSWYLKRSQGSG